MKPIAVVITTYNNPRSLELCLSSLKNQTDTFFEVMIADDGSGDETRDLILRMKRECKFPITHFWQPDLGYRKAKINNRVFSQIDENRFSILICIDHDVVLHHRFIADHRLEHQKVNEEPLLFMGRRVDLGPELTAKLNPENVLKFNQGLSFALVQSAIQGETKNILRSIRLDLPNWLKKITKRDRVYDLLGSNFSVTLKVMKQVNGYNEDYQSYWGEDGDLFVRIRNSGIKIKGTIGIAVQWHLNHRRLAETPEHINQYQNLLKNNDYRRCRNGIEKS